MRQIKIICDKCKRSELVEHEKDSQLKVRHIGVAVLDPNKVRYSGYSAEEYEIRASAEWCEDCRLAVGLTCNGESHKLPQAYWDASPENQLITALTEIINSISNNNR